MHYAYVAVYTYMSVHRLKCVYVYVLESTCTYKDDGVYVGVGVCIHTYLYAYIDKCVGL